MSLDTLLDVTWQIVVTVKNHPVCKNINFNMNKKLIREIHKLVFYAFYKIYILAHRMIFHDSKWNLAHTSRT